MSCSGSANVSSAASDQRFESNADGTAVIHWLDNSTWAVTTKSVVAGVKSPSAALGLSAKGIPLHLGGSPADDAWWRLRKALAIARLRGCAWVMQVKMGIHHDVVGPFEEAELAAVLQGPGGPSGCKSAWALDELAAGSAPFAA